MTVAVIAVGAYHASDFFKAESNLPLVAEEASRNALSPRLKRLEELVDNLERERLDRSRDPRESSLSTGLLDRLEALTVSIDAINGRLENLENRFHLLNTQDQSLDVGLTREQRQEQRAEVRAEENERRRQYLASLDQLIMQEETNDPISGLVSDHMNSVIQRKVNWSGTQLSTMQCGETLCKFELDFPPGMADIDQFELEHTLLAEIAEHLPTGNMQIEGSANGGKRIVAYMARQGHRLPPPQSPLN